MNDYFVKCVVVSNKLRENKWGIAWKQKWRDQQEKGKERDRGKSTNTFTYLVQLIRREKNIYGIRFDTPCISSKALCDAYPAGRCNVLPPCIMQFQFTPKWIKVFTAYWTGHLTHDIKPGLLSSLLALSASNWVKYCARRVFSWDEIRRILTRFVHVL